MPNLKELTVSEHLMMLRDQNLESDPSRLFIKEDPLFEIQGPLPYDIYAGASPNPGEAARVDALPQKAGLPHAALIARGDPSRPSLDDKSIGAELYKPYLQGTRDLGGALHGEVDAKGAVRFGATGRGDVFGGAGTVSAQRSIPRRPENAPPVTVDSYRATWEGPVGKGQLGFGAGLTLPTVEGEMLRPSTSLDAGYKVPFGRGTFGAHGHLDRSPGGKIGGSGMLRYTLPLGGRR
tara:strand:+ start:2094 stop:2801 length:708 start_codon:yes stop_codon:yes gene_type:complete